MFSFFCSASATFSLHVIFKPFSLPLIFSFVLLLFISLFHPSVVYCFIYINSFMLCFLSLIHHLLFFTSIISLGSLDFHNRSLFTFPIFPPYCFHLSNSKSISILSFSMYICFYQSLDARILPLTRC